MSSSTKCPRPKQPYYRDTSIRTYDVRGAQSSRLRVAPGSPVQPSLDPDRNLLIDRLPSDSWQVPVDFGIPRRKQSGPVLEFGCGVGGNLFALSSRIPFGFGIDINPLYILQGTRLGRRLGIANVSLEHYNGKIIPKLRSKVGTVLSLAVFERIQKSVVLSYLMQLKQLLKPGGHMILYFLAERAKDTTFDQLLGPEAYIYWSDDEIANLFEATDFRIDRKIPFEAGTIEKNGRRTTAADVWVVAPRSA